MPTPNYALPTPPDSTFVADAAKIIRDQSTTVDGVLLNQETRVLNAEQSAKDASLLVGAPAAAAISAAITPGGGSYDQFTASLDNHRPLIDLVSEIKWPLFVAHRGGAARFPEHSLEGYREAVRGGFTPEQDIEKLADNTLVCLHDTTVDRTMYDITGPIRSITPDQWINARLRPAIYGAQRAMPFFWEDVLDEFGGQQLLFPEVRDDPDMVTNFIYSITRRNLQRCIIAQTFYWDVALQLVAAGITTCYLSDSANPATLKAAGIEYTSCNYPVATAAYIAGHNAEGIRVVPYGNFTYDNVQDLLNNRGAFGVISDDPWAHSGRFIEKKTQTYNDGHGWVGSEGRTTADSLVPLGHNQMAYRLVNLAGSLRAVEQGWSDRIWSSSVNIEWDMKLNAQHIGWGTGQESARVYLSDALHRKADESHQNWVMLMIRRSGQAVVYRRKAGGTIEALATVNGFTPALAEGEEGQRYRYKLSISNAGDVTITRSGGTTPITIPAANYGLENLWGLWLSAATVGQVAEYSDWLIYQ